MFDTRVGGLLPLSVLPRDSQLGGGRVGKVGNFPNIGQLLKGQVS